MQYKYNTELEIYPDIVQGLKSKGYEVIKLEQKALPDFLAIGKIILFIEVKLYRGRELMEEWDLETAIKKVHWRPGQVRMLRLFKARCPQAYQLWIFNKTGGWIVL